jgi:hypothetical protein
LVAEAEGVEMKRRDIPNPKDWLPTNKVLGIVLSISA